MLRLHRRDHTIDDAPLRGMHRRGPGMVERAQLQVVSAGFKHPPVAELKDDVASPHRDDLGRVAVDEAEPGFVARPADAVAGA